MAAIRPTPNIMDLIHAREDQTLISDALEHYAEVMLAASEHVPAGTGKQTLRHRTKRARELATIINQGGHHGR